MAKINTNTQPYFDDYDPKNKFYRILYKPGFPVQSRELTQSQTLLQEQLKRFGDHIFENKSLVIPGDISFDTRYAFIKIPKTDNANTKEEIVQFWLGQTIYQTDVGPSGNVQAQVIHYLEANAEDEVVLFIKYVAGSTDGSVTSFLAGDSIQAVGSGATSTIPGTSVNPEGVVGLSSLATISEGVYFVRGFFVLVEEQISVISAFSSTPSARVGLQIVESIVTPEDDSSLKSNATGSPNFAAPGADRLKIELVLTTKPLNLNSIPDPDEEDDFIELLRLRNGQLLKKIDRSSYSILMDTLARRTSDESGDYALRPFLPEIKEFYNENGNGGVYSDQDFFFETPEEVDELGNARLGTSGNHFDPNASGFLMPGATHQEFLDAVRDRLVVAIDPSKAYVRGYEIETINKTYVDLLKSRETAFTPATTINTQVGNYVLIDNLNGVPDITNFSKVDLYDTPLASDGTPAGTKIGEARIRGIEYDSGTIATNMDAAIYKLFLFDISTNAGNIFEQVKALHQDRGTVGPGLEDFSCNIKLEEQLLRGTISSSGTTITGIGTLFQSVQSERLRVGDFIKAGDQLLKVATVASDVSATLTTTPSPVLTNSNFYYVYAELKGLELNSMIFPLSHAAVKTIRDQNDDCRTFFTVRREFAATVSGGFVTLNLPLYPDEEFDSFNPLNYVVTKVSGAGGPAIGRIFNYNDLVGSITPGQIQFSHPDFQEGDSMKVIATVNKKLDAALEKSKTYTPGEVFNSPASEKNLQSVKLGKADVAKIVKITMSPDTTFAAAALDTDTDITDRYDLDSGQRDNMYDIGRVVLKPTALPPTGRIRVEFDFFEHSGTGKNYFSVNSYDIDYADIPDYTSVEKGLIFELSDCLDFRPTIKDDSSGFDNVTGSLTEMPVSNTTADYSYYLNRIDKLSLDYNGEFVVRSGVPGLKPAAPAPSEQGMLLYTLSVPAYTYGPKDVLVEIQDNRRYTMRDIGKLERRIERVEYYTALSLLEKETADLEITDENGLDRFKNGFIVDPFSGHGIGDVLNPDYKCAVDPAEGLMRASFHQKNTPLGVSSLSNCVITGPLVTLPYTETVALTQGLASESMNVNPYSVFTFLGNIKLDPAFDEWKETNTLPDLIVEQDQFSTVAAQVNAQETVWNEWETNWVGVEAVTGPRERTGTIYGKNPPDAHHKTRWPRQRVFTTRTTTTTTTAQSRTGIRNKAVPRTVVQNLGERVIDVSYLPFMRTRDLVFEGKGFKPSTRLVPFFDNVNVAQFTVAGPTWNGLVVSNLSNPQLITDVTGKVSGIFRIPNSGTRFKTGERVFRLTDRENNDKKFSTAGQTTYRAQGLIETKQSTILSTRVADIVQEVVTEGRVLTDVETSELIETSKWIDPLAQSFLLDESGGCFITKIRVYFETKDSNIPVTLQIREMVNGYPGPRVLPFAEVTLDSSSVNVSDFATIGTDFVFDAPVYLQQNTEYCFVVLANSQEYYLHIARTETNAYNTDIPIMEQPYAGVLFKSQNASTWSADQAADMKFDIFKAVFNTGVAGNLILVNNNGTNDANTSLQLSANPLEFTEGSNKIRVNHPNHGMPSITAKKSRVRLIGITNGMLNNINDILLTDLNTEHEVTDVDFDSYVITVDDNSSATSRSGGSTVVATENRQMDAMLPIIGELVFPKTNINYGARVTLSRSPHAPASIEPYKVDTDYFDVLPNTTYLFDDTMLIASNVNEGPLVIPGGSKTFFLRATMSSTNANISPVIDLGRVSVVSIANRIDSPQPYGQNSINFEPTDLQELVDSVGNLVFNTNNTLTSTNASTAEGLSQAVKGKYLKVVGSASNDGYYRIMDVLYTPADSTKITITVEGEATLASETPASVTVYQLRKFIDERAPKSGSSLFKYVSRRIQLAEPAIGLQIRFSAMRPPEADIEVYYKVGNVDDPTPFDDINYQLASFDASVAASGGPDDIKEYQLTVSDLPDFALVAVKLVGKSSNTAQVPVFYDLAVIALGS